MPDAADKAQSWKIFDRIAHRYDLLNRLLSFGRDVAWRKRLLWHLPEGKALRLLDLATGTADVLLTLYRKSGRIGYGVGADRSAGMLLQGREKLRAQAVENDLSLVLADGVQLGFAENGFDVATIAFGIRNIPDVDAGLRELYRVLKPGGRVLILEFSLPGNRLIRTGYLFYFRHILPRIGGLISGDPTAYRYLNETVESFPYGEAFCALMRTAGFQDLQAHPLTFGIATLYCGDKKPADDPEATSR